MKPHWRTGRCQRWNASIQARCLPSTAPKVTAARPLKLAEDAFVEAIEMVLKSVRRRQGRLGKVRRLFILGADDCRSGRCDALAAGRDPRVTPHRCCLTSRVCPSACLCLRKWTG